MAQPFAKVSRRGDNRFMVNSQPEAADPAMQQKSASAPPLTPPFSPGSMVVVTLGNPRDKFWGKILSLASEGLSISGIELASFDDFVVMVKEGESFTPAVVFFPMHRVERIELDLPDGNLASLSQRFSAKTGLDPAALLGLSGFHAESVDPVASASIHAAKDLA